jgi:hypothetical protein
MPEGRSASSHWRLIVMILLQMFCSCLPILFVMAGDFWSNALPVVYCSKKQLGQCHDR